MSFDEDWLTKPHLDPLPPLFLGKAITGVSWDEVHRESAKIRVEDIQALLALQSVSLISTVWEELGMVDNPDDPLDDPRNIVGQFVDFTQTTRAHQWFAMVLLLVISTALFFASPPFNIIGFIAWVMLVFQLREKK